MMRFDIGHLSREIAAYVPIALVKQFETRRLQCAACFDAHIARQEYSPRLPASGAIDLSFHRLRP